MSDRFRKAWLVLQREYVERVRSKAFILFTLLMPALMAASILVPAKLADIRSGEFRHIVIVASNSELATAIQQQLVKPEPLAHTNAHDNQASANRYIVDINDSPTEQVRNQLRRQVNEGKLDGFLWLSDDALASHKITYSAKDVADFGEAAELRSAIRAAILKQRLAIKGIASSEVDELLTPTELDTVRITEGNDGGSGLAVFLISFFMVLLLYTNVLVYGIAVMRSTIEEKSSRVIEVLLSSLTAKELLAGKVLGVGAVGLTQMVIWLVLGLIFSLPGALASRNFVSQVHIPAAEAGAFAVFFLLGYLLYSTIYAALGAMVNSEQEAQQMQWPAMLPLIFSIFLATPVLQHPNTTMAFWLSIIPFFSPVLMFIRIAVDQPPLWQVALSVALMLVTIYGLLVFASRIYRVGILMYGKRPTLAELRRWLRYSG